jgi:putative transposase
MARGWFYRGFRAYWNRTPMVQYQLKLRLSKAQKAKQLSWLPILGAVYNFGIRKIELNAQNNIYFSVNDVRGLLPGHGQKLGLPAHTLQGVLTTAYHSWQRCFEGKSKKPKLKGARRPLNSISFPDPINAPVGNKIQVPGMGKVRFHKQGLPAGKIKCGRLVKRASGDYLCLFIDAQPMAIARTGEAIMGIDPGFNDLLTLSNGEKIGHPREFRGVEKRLGQAQRGHNKTLASRIQGRAKSRRRDRNHKLSRRLVAENKVICFLKDNHRAISKRFGKSVSDSGHGGLRQMLSYKSLIGGTELIFPENRNSTKTCSTCGGLTGPSGLSGLAVRNWACTACGAEHDRDQNAAQNALNFGAGRAHETARGGCAASGIPGLISGSVTLSLEGSAQSTRPQAAQGVGVIS